MKLSKAQQSTYFSTSSTNSASALSRTMSHALSISPRSNNQQINSSPRRGSPHFFERQGQHQTYDPILSRPHQNEPPVDIIWMDKRQFKWLLITTATLFATCILLLVLLVSVLLYGSSSCSSQGKSSRDFKLVLPHHFSLSILSPFTSVVRYLYSNLLNAPSCNNKHNR
ncbi:hypothetical protein DL96DRAFT_461948 [Flagelloscypha sp. PMI_526]|nr:hypothetical protein DL96DRAFT_461948 [Flagelloscypha sp. PMI_526]